MTGPFETPPGRRSVGPVAAYRRALGSLFGALCLTYAFSLLTIPWYFEESKYIGGEVSSVPPQVELTFDFDAYGYTPVPSLNTPVVAGEFPSGFATFVFERVTWEPVLAFLLVGAAIAVVAPRRARIAAFVEEMQFV